MRQAFVRVSRGSGSSIAAAARDLGALNVAVLEGTDGHDPIDLVLVDLPNDAVAGLIERADRMGPVAVSLIPTGVLALAPPAGSVPEEVRSVGSRSSIEVYLAALQSVGSWRGFLTYAVTAGSVVWLGLVTNTVYLLVAAMLLAPFASPALTAAVATARGDLQLLARSVARYGAAISATVVVSAALTVLFGIGVETSLMADVSNISALTFILPLAAGIAGGLHLVQGEQNSLVSGAAVGILVAASIAPPAGIVGMAAVIGQWSMVLDAAFLVGLQLVGINVAAALVFRLYGLRPSGVRYDRGRAIVSRGAAAVALAAFVGLVSFQQLSPDPTLVRSSIEQQARQLVVTSLDEQLPDVHLANATVTFTRADVPGQNTLLVSLDVEPGQSLGASDAAIRSAVTDLVRRAILDADLNVTALVDVQVLRAS